MEDYSHPAGRNPSRDGIKLTLIVLTGVVLKAIRVLIGRESYDSTRGRGLREPISGAWSCRVEDRR
jgi:hypothetical protein